MLFPAGAMVPTAQVVAAYLQCKTKGTLLWQCITGDDPDFLLPLMHEYKTASRASLEQQTGRTLIDFVDLTSRAGQGNAYLIDAESTSVDMAAINELPKSTTNNRDSACAPALFLPFEQADSWHKALLHFAAFAIRNSVGASPSVAYICYGKAVKIKSIKRPDIDERKIGDLARAIFAAAHGGSPVPLVLNKHCAVCEYRMRCRREAIDCDNLSLIPSIGEKERRKHIERGINSITQFSYTNRPRRKRRMHATPRPESLITAKNDSRLKALSIRKGQVHIANAQPPKIAGTQVYFDVEGIPGEEVYYLVGMRFQAANAWTEISYWADSHDQERDIWRQSLGTLLALESPQLVHYGHYEAAYLARMRDRYPDLLPERGRFEALTSNARNLLKSIYGQVYFPTYTNGLKDVAGFLGFRWSDPGASGSLASLWRLGWELNQDDYVKQKLIQYNMDDCRAAQVVADALDGMFDKKEEDTSKYVDVDTLKVPYQRTYGPFASPLPDFRNINNAAYWNYQRERVYVRSDQQLRIKSTARRRPGNRAPPRPDKTIKVEGHRPEQCPRCGSGGIWKAGLQGQTEIDIVFSKKGARRQITRTTRRCVRGWALCLGIYQFDYSCICLLSRARRGSAPWNVGRIQRCAFSDFYGAYDAVECMQQRCLIHLMRDINDGLMKFPFNSELSGMAAKFGEVLRVIVDTIDRRGLKCRFLRKHKKQVNRFMNEIKSTKYTTEVAISLRKRFVKHRTKLFTFLDYDGVPWNNNNAEHAVRAFTRIRNMMSTSTAKGTKEYAILLSVQQTLKYRNMNLLRFLRSGSTEIEDLT